MIFCAITIQAQNNIKNKTNVRHVPNIHNKVVRNKKTIVNDKHEQKITNMFAATQKINIIDSIVIDKDKFLDGIKLNKESGSITKYNNFFKTQDQPHSYVYCNEFGNKCYYSKSDSTGGSHLYTSDKIGGKWASPTRISFDLQSDNLNYPYMMTDGTTLYFASKGEGSLGGYDIFVTRYDTDNDKFLKPDNIGLPFNSTANDYMYAENDLDSIGWFVSDRNQAEGKVCIYIFIPSETRTTYDPTVYSQAEIHRFARIQSIKDTWINDNIHNEYMERYNAMITRENKETSKEDFEFIINDDITYTSLNDFKSPTDKEEFASLLKSKALLNDKLSNLDAMRDKYHNTTDANERMNLSKIILQTEDFTFNEQRRIIKMEKSIRNTENLLNNK